MEYGQLLDAYKALVNQLIGSKVAEDSISPTDVAQAHIQLADLLEPILNTINDFAITGGTLPPLDASGQDLDLYIQGGTSLIFWRKRNGVWVMEADVELGIQIIDGNITLQASIDGQIVTVSAGSWGINNIVYSKATQTQLNVSNADLNFNRIDAVIADTTESISIITGVASSNPVTPAIPANTIVVSYVYVPASSTGDLPYIADSNASPQSIIDDAVISLVKTWSSQKLNVIPQLWSADPTPLNGVRWHDIGGIKYPFYSLVDNNTSEPTLSSSASGAWTRTDIYGFLSVYDPEFSYDIGALITSDGNTRVYRSKVNANEGHFPSGGVSTEFWEYVGKYRGFYNALSTYSQGDVVIVSAESDRIYISNISANKEPLTDIGGDSTWQVIGEVGSASKSQMTLNQSALVEEFEGQYYLPFTIPSGKDVLSCYYQITGETIRRYKNMGDLTFDETRGSNPYQFGSFDNNSPQTITIIYT